MMMLKSKMDIQLDPPTTLKSTAVLQAPFEPHARWKKSQKARPTIPNSIRDIIHGNHFYTPAKRASTMQMMSKENDPAKQPPTANPQKQRSFNILSSLKKGLKHEPNHRWKKQQQFQPSQLEKGRSFPTFVDWNSGGLSSHSDSVDSFKPIMNTNGVMLHPSNDNPNSENADDDFSLQVYGEILTPDWRAIYVDPPTSNLQTSPNEISAQQIATELSDVQEKTNSSQEELKKKEGVSEEITVPKVLSEKENDP